MSMRWILGVLLLGLVGCKSHKAVVSSNVETERWHKMYDSVRAARVSVDTIRIVRWRVDSVTKVERQVVRDSIVLRVDNDGTVVGRDSWHSVENDRGVERLRVDSNSAREASRLLDSLVAYRGAIDSLKSKKEQSEIVVKEKTRPVPGFVWFIVLGAGLLFGWCIWRK